MSTEPEDPWVTRYKRLMLDHLKAPQDVDLATVVISPSYSERHQYSEYTIENESFDIDIQWEYPTPPPRAWNPKPNENGMYDHGERLSNEEVAEFLRSLI